MSNQQSGPIAGKLDLVIEQGADFTRTLTFTDSGGAAINITGYTFRMQGRVNKSSTTTLFNYGTAQFTITGGTAGVVALSVAGSITAAYDFDTGVYDMEWVTPSGAIKRILEGNITLSREVTR